MTPCLCHGLQRTNTIAPALTDSRRFGSIHMARTHLKCSKNLPARLLAAFVLAVLPAKAFSQDNPAGQLSPKKLELGQKQSELDQLAADAKLSEQRMAELAAEIDKLKNDELSVTAALIQSAKTQKKLAFDVAAIEERLATQREEESAVKVSLQSRRGVLAEVLGALQRMGLNPPPAILVKPDDALSSVRSAILLGAVVPELRSETEKLIADLDALKRITNSISTERANLLAGLKAQGEEEHRLNALIAEKKRLREQTEQARKAEEERIASLVQKSGSLKDVLEALRKDIESEDQANERARRDEEKRIALERDKARRSADSAILKPGISLAELKGSLVMPVSAKGVRPFGSDDGFGGRTAGIYAAADEGSLVTTPVDATVLYAGPFRSYHQLLILDAGNQYQLVMGGMDTSMVSTGQFLLAGEPVGTLGKAKASSATSLTKLPELYIELRHEGKPVDSAPWWAGEPNGRTGNAT